MDIRSAASIERLESFNKSTTFLDDIRLEVYLDFKRESLDTIKRLGRAISNC